MEILRYTLQLSDKQEKDNIYDYNNETKITKYVVVGNFGNFGRPRSLLLWQKIVCAVNFSGRTYGQQESRQTVAKSLAACDTRRLHEENQLRFSNSKHFRFH